MPVSAARCWDWKYTASVSLHLGHRCWVRGSCVVDQSVKALEKEGFAAVVIMMGLRFHPPDLTDPTDLSPPWLVLHTVRT